MAVAVVRWRCVEGCLCRPLGGTGGSRSTALRLGERVQQCGGLAQISAEGEI